MENINSPTRSSFINNIRTEPRIFKEKTPKKLLLVPKSLTKTPPIATERTSKKDEALVSSGGRVLTVTGVGEDLTEARNLAYRAISQISLAGSFYRTDIALNASVAEKGN